MAGILGGTQNNKNVAVYAHEKISLLQHSIEKDREYIYANGKGMFSAIVYVKTLDIVLRSRRCLCGSHLQVEARSDGSCNTMYLCSLVHVVGTCLIYLLTSS